MGISSFHPHGEGGAACIFHLTCGHAEVPRGQETTCSQQRFSSCWSGVWGQGPVHPARSIIECRQPRFQWVGGGVGVFLHLNSPDCVQGTEGRDNSCCIWELSRTSATEKKTRAEVVSLKNRRV